MTKPGKRSEPAKAGRVSNQFVEKLEKYGASEKLLKKLKESEEK